MPPDGTNPLERTPDMANLTPAERARIYKERAAAAGIGRPPAAGQDGAPPPAPAPPPPAPAERPAPAAAAGGGGGAGALTPERRQRLAAAVQRGPVAAGGGGGGAAAATATRPAAAATAAPAAEAQQNRLVYVWPHLVTIEFLSAVLMLVSMIVISMVIQAPLEG